MKKKPRVKISKKYAKVYFGKDDRFVTLVSLCDLTLVTSKRLVISSRRFLDGYAHMCFENKKRVLLHRAIMRPKKDQVCDHINRNTLDNRRENLRLCTRQENCRNRIKGVGFNKFKGVTYDSKKKLFRARITLDRRRIGLGRFKDEQEAARAYNRAAIKYHGEFARLNDLPKTARTHGTI